MLLHSPNAGARMPMSAARVLPFCLALLACAGPAPAPDAIHRNLSGNTLLIGNTQTPSLLYFDPDSSFRSWVPGRTADRGRWRVLADSVCTRLDARADGAAFAEQCISFVPRRVGGSWPGENSKTSAMFYSLQAGYVTRAADIHCRPDDHLCRQFEKFFIAYETRGARRAAASEATAAKRP